MIPRQLLATDSHRPRVNADASGPLILHLPYILMARAARIVCSYPAWESVLAPSKRARAINPNARVPSKCTYSLQSHLRSIH